VNDLEERIAELEGRLADYTHDMKAAVEQRHDASMRAAHELRDWAYGIGIPVALGYLVVRQVGNNLVGLGAGFAAFVIVFWLYARNTDSKDRFAASRLDRIPVIRQRDRGPLG
jgi:hypothetical protein